MRSPEPTGQSDTKWLELVIRLVAALLLGTGAFVASVYVQDLLQGDLRLPIACLDDQGKLTGCPQPQPNAWIAGAVGLVVAGIAFYVSGRFRNRQQVQRR